MAAVVGSVTMCDSVQLLFELLDSAMRERPRLISKLFADLDRFKDTVLNSDGILVLLTRAFPGMVVPPTIYEAFFADLDPAGSGLVTLARIEARTAEWNAKLTPLYPVLGAHPPVSLWLASVVGMNNIKTT